MSVPTLRRAALGFGTSLFLACALSTPAVAQTTLTTELVFNGMTKPVAALSPPGDSRIFVVEQNSGKIKIFDGTSVLATEFLNVKAKIKSSGNEEGLLGLAFHPDYANNGYFYINYTASNPNRTVVERYLVSVDPNIARASSGTTIISYTQPFSNHNGGDLRFGPDGYLYIGTGDGGSANDPACRAQNPAVPLGKMLRIDVDNGLPYTVPASNPYVGVAGAMPEIWSIGLRNPWRYSFDALTGELYIGDVGQNAVEEVNTVPPSDAGYNFGWKIMEGPNCFSTSSCPGGIPACNDVSLTMPVSSYGHTGGFGGGCSITGGEVYRGCKIPDFFGTYFFADYCSNLILSMEVVGGVAQNLTNRTTELKPAGLSINSITSFGVDGDGEILIVDQTGEIFRIIAQTQPAIADCDANGKDDTCEITMNPSLDMNGNMILDSCEPTCGYTAYGAGASPANTIVLTGSGTGQIGTVASFDSSGVNAASALYFASLGQGNFPVVGGVGLVSLPLTILSAVTPAAGGNASWAVPIPASGALVGLGVYVQSAATDAGQPGGWALSNGLELIVCP